jgi:glycosyltransferase involved in cell wall biosynthesis
MRVLLANSTCKLGGVSTFMLGLQSALRGLGHECELFFFSGGSMESRLPPDANAHFGTLTDCLRLIARRGFTVVHANNIDWATGISAVRQIGARLVLTAHKARETAWTYGWNSSNCDALVTVSAWVRGELQPFTDVPIQVVPNGIDVETFSPAPRPPTSPPIVAWIGRSGSPLKGLEKLAAVAPGLKAAGLRLWIIDQHGAQKAAETYPDAARILEPLAERWEGVPMSAMPDLYRDVAASGGCVLSTSIREGLPLTLLEAQAAGCLVVASDVPGNNECVSPEHGGLLFPLEQPGDDIARATADVLREPDGVRARQSAAMAYVRERFSVRGMAEQYLRIYRESPYPVTTDLRTRVKARLRLSPIVNWGDYLQQRWGVGYEQLASSRALAAHGEWELAAGAGRASLHTCPTLYLRPGRIAHLVSLLARARTRT